VSPGSCSDNDRRARAVALARWVSIVTMVRRLGVESTFGLALMLG
jgi:hypothetical protein